MSALKRAASASASKIVRTFASILFLSSFPFAAKAKLGVACVSSDALAYRGGVYRGGVHRVGAYHGGLYRGGAYRGAYVRRGVGVAEKLDLRNTYERMPISYDRREGVLPDGWAGMCRIVPG